ncbi:hypothetical protein [Ensifer sp. ENS04]|uniref:esterase/lipase family protein n=1 Tax=Ensifer sp. ENS04 TaxID=2769281 RepID=UPI001FF06EF8|nr:hypothetical protein [Ensifer sp. ENS04]
MDHSVAVALPWGQGSVGYFAKQPARRLLVFVHGFGGSASATWAGTEASLAADPRAGTCDLIYFGYRSFHAQPEMSAGILRGFLDEAAGAGSKWNALASRALGVDVAREYDEVLVIAHSLGAPISRRALLDAIQEKAPWASKVRLQLFAPAHLGAFLHKVREELGVVSGLIASLTALATLGIRSLDGLKPNSPFLTQLIKDSRQELANGWEAQIKAREVIFGDGENVVMVQRFLNDPPPTVWAGHGHRSVCRCDLTAPAIARHLI